MSFTKANEKKQVMLTAVEEIDVSGKRQMAEEANFSEKCKMILGVLAGNSKGGLGRDMWSLDLGDGVEIKREINSIYLPQHYAECNKMDTVSVIFNGKEVLRHEEFHDVEDSKNNTNIITGFIQGEWGGDIDMIYGPSKRYYTLINTDTEEAVKHAFELQKNLQKTFETIRDAVREGNGKRTAFGMPPVMFFDEAERHEAFMHLLRGGI